MTQAKREVALSRFRHVEGGLLIATNVAARGLDIVDVSDVINFDSPDEPAIYIHRVGRSARMGRDGRAFTVVQRDEQSFIYNVEKFANIKFNRIDLDLDKFKDINFGKYFSGRDSESDSGRHFGHRSHFEGQRSNHFGGDRDRRYGARDSNSRDRPRSGRRFNDRSQRRPHSGGPRREHPNYS